MKTLVSALCALLLLTATSKCQLGNWITILDTSTTINEFDGTADWAQFDVSFRLTAIGDYDLFIELDTFRGTSTDPDAGASFIIENFSGQVLTGTTAAVLENIGGGQENDNFVRISEGNSADFRLSVAFTPATTGFYSMSMLSANTNTVQAPENDQFFVQGNEGEASAVFLNAPVPEPSTLALIGPGLLALMCRRRR